jgi:hypothetical protein
MRLGSCKAGRQEVGKMRRREDKKIRRSEVEKIGKSEGEKMGSEEAGTLKCFTATPFIFPAHQLMSFQAS